MAPDMVGPKTVAVYFFRNKLASLSAVAVSFFTKAFFTGMPKDTEIRVSAFFDTFLDKMFMRIYNNRDPFLEQKMQTVIVRIKCFPENKPLCFRQSWLLHKDDTDDNIVAAF